MKDVFILVAFSPVRLNDFVIFSWVTMKMTTITFYQVRD
jgi:hypothetical protein